MTCRRIETQLDDYLDGALEAEVEAGLVSHAQECSDCERALARAESLRRVLAQLPVQGPSPSFFEKALNAAARQRTRAEAKSIAPVWYAGAVAAGLAALAVVGLLGTPAEEPAAPTQGLAQVAMAVEETRTINLVFASDEALEDVSLTVELPEGVELANYPGQGRVLWSTRLQAGKNVLPLELVALGGTGGELVATMRRDDKEKVFRVNIAVLMG
jgi:anti-sigma factor RsiW